MDVRIKTARLKDASEENDLKDNEFIVYPATFIKEPDSYGDVINEHAFDETVEKWNAGQDKMPILFAHDPYDVKNFIGAADTMSIDAHGWKVKGHFFETETAQQVRELLKERVITKLSFAFRVLDEGTIELDDGVKANELRKLDVSEASFVLNPANPDTSIVAMKNSAPIKPALDWFLQTLADGGEALKDFLTHSSEEPDSRTSVNAKSEEPKTAKDEERKQLEALSLQYEITSRERF